MLRLFVAIPIPDEVRQRLLAISSGVRGARWVRPEGMHITLFFAGEMDRDQANDLDAELETVQMPAFELSCRGLGYFERGSRIKSVWAGIEPSESLVYLHDRVESAAVKAGFERETRKFTPHITLARLKGGRADDIGPWIETHDHLSTPPFTVEGFTLYRSHLAREGAMYDPMVEYQISG
jgi:2'-5' RNA ligase